MIRFLILVHLLGLVLGMGGLLCQLVLLAKYCSSTDPKDRIGSERGARTIILLVQMPGVYLSAGTGVALAWILQWAPLAEGWLQFKLLFFFWVLLATNLMWTNVRNLHSLREQCGDEDSKRLLALKDNHRMIGYVTVLAFVFIVIFSLWKPF